MHKPFVTVIIVAGGNSTRMGGKVSKQLIKISGKFVIEYSLDAFSRSDYVNEIIVSAKADELDVIKSFMTKFPKLKAVVCGGKVRQESVSNALSAMDKRSEIVAIHDAARPLIKTTDIDAIIHDTVVYGAVCPVSKVSDTVKYADNAEVVKTLDRNSLFLASTPQIFKTEIYLNAFNNAVDFEKYTDDASIVEAFGQKVHLYIMENENRKITNPNDLNIIKSYLGGDGVRVGHGYDVHKLVDGRKLILGGVDIPHEVGLLGHSDADVLVHAIMDALLGAAGLGDIGRHFPDIDDCYKGISSITLLEKVNSLIKDEGYLISNIDATVVAQAPKLLPYISTMRENIAQTLRVDVSQVNLKATTEEHLGFTGEKLGISAHAVCVLLSIY